MYPYAIVDPNDASDLTDPEDVSDKVPHENTFNKLKRKVDNVLGVNTPFSVNESQRDGLPHYVRFCILNGIKRSSKQEGDTHETFVHEAVFQVTYRSIESVIPNILVIVRMSIGILVAVNHGLQSFPCHYDCVIREVPCESR
ncbi:unnamed protein product [Polarella glacialis]|uniref:Uncharacterized protein n=1 Tax=Polarella glacialis TaxID=89957 RepID=A0A813JAF9_POLGL|nr:unnamed protein product [Polarella glacialis]